MHFHRLVRAALTAVAVIVLAAIMPIAAHAQGDVYRFWGYYQWTDGAWAYCHRWAGRGNAYRRFGGGLAVCGRRIGTARPACGR